MGGAPFGPRHRLRERPPVIVYCLLAIHPVERSFYSQRLAFFGKPGRCTRTMQKRWPVGASITTQRCSRLTTMAPNFSRRATLAGISSEADARSRQLLAIANAQGYAAAWSPNGTAPLGR